MTTKNTKDVPEVASHALFACPFCGFDDEPTFDGYRDMAVSCPNCGAQGPSDIEAWGTSDDPRPANHYEAWNRRSSPWCEACKEADCVVSSDGTCAMIRKYLANVES